MFNVAATEFSAAVRHGLEHPVKDPGVF